MKKMTSILLAFSTAILATVSTGCVSGGYKLTRDYSGWVNSKHIVIRVILYLLTPFVWVITLVVDVVVFNTQDFWEGRISEGIYEFKENNKTFVVEHQLGEQNQLKRTTIIIIDDLNGERQKLVLQETPDHKVEVWQNGELMAVQG